jgi:hypothetical protein
MAGKKRMRVSNFVTMLRQSTSVGHPQLTTGIPVGMETRGSESLVITCLHGSRFLFWVLRVLATSTCETIVIYLLFY